jgi:hypothetical protein
MRRGGDTLRDTTLPVSDHGQVVLALVMLSGLWVTLVSLHLSGSGEAAATHAALLQEEYERRLAHSSALRQMRPINMEAAYWMGYRPSIDMPPKHRHANPPASWSNLTPRPGGAKDHKDATPDSSRKKGVDLTLTRPRSLASCVAPCNLTST